MVISRKPGQRNSSHSKGGERPPFQKTERPIERREGKPALDSSREKHAPVGDDSPIRPFLDSGSMRPRRLMVNKEGRPEKVTHQDIPCRNLLGCGSCHLLAGDYRKALQQKTDDLKAKLKEAGMPEVQVLDCTPSPERTGYRHTAKLVIAEEEHSRSGGRWLKIGLYKPGTHEVIDIPKCAVQADAINRVVGYLRSAIKEFDIPVYMPRTKKDGLRYVVVRTSSTTRQTLVTLVSSAELKQKLRALARDMLDKVSNIQGVLEHVNPTSGNEIFSPEEVSLGGLGNTHLLAGENFLEEEIAGLNLKISSTSFFQVNPAMAEKMYFRILEVTAPERNESALDLYCGVGAIGLSLAKEARFVLGVEETRSSILDAERNAKYNDLDNIQFHSGRAEDILDDVLSGQKVTKIDVVTVNPSRRGCDPSVLERVAALAPRAIAYMSCYPQTLLRDVKFLLEKGYKPLFFEPYDMFPGTSHYEVLTLLVPGD